jgi:hypothetical protein
MTRRDAFSKLRRNETPSIPSDTHSPAETLPTTGLPGSIKPLDFIPAAEPRQKRERQWEKTHQVEIATYRGIPPETRQTLTRLAESLNVSVDEVVRALLEYGLTCCRSGALKLSPHPKAQRMTLFPRDESIITTSATSWLKDALPLSQPMKKKKKDGQSKPWEARVTYRLPPELKQEIKSIADEHFIPVGELVFYLFLHSLDAYGTGRLSLTPHPKPAGYTLF